MPDRGERFLGTSGRARARALERRRRVFTVLLEGMGLTFLIGVVPPLRPMWTVSALLAGMLLVYVWMLLRLRAQRDALRAAPTDDAVASRPGPARPETPLIAAITTPEYPVIVSEDGRRVVVISDAAARRHSTVAG